MVVVPLRHDGRPRPRVRHVHIHYCPRFDGLEATGRAREAVVAAAMTGSIMRHKQGTSQMARGALQQRWACTHCGDNTSARSSAIGSSSENRSCCFPMSTCSRAVPCRPATSNPQQAATTQATRPTWSHKRSHTKTTLRACPNSSYYTAARTRDGTRFRVLSTASSAFNTSTFSSASDLVGINHSHRQRMSPRQAQRTRAATHDAR